MSIVYLEKRAMSTAKYSIAVLDKLKQHVVSRGGGKLLKGSLFLQGDSSSSQGPHYAPEICKYSL
jgi:hypothetical protein